MNETPQFRFLPLSIRLETVGGIATPLVLKGTPLPATRHEVFSTAADNQKAVTLVILMGEGSLARRCITLGKVDFTDIPAAPRGVPQIEVTFEVDEACSVRVTAKAGDVALSASTTENFTPPRLTEDKIQEVRALSEVHKEADQREVSLIEASRDARNRIAEAEAMLADTKNRQRPEVAEGVAALGEALETEDPEQIRERTRQLTDILRPALSSFDSFESIFSPHRPKRQPQATRFQRPAAPKLRTDQKQKTKGPAAEIDRRESRPPLGKIFGGGNFTLDSSLCFVLMPFATNFEPIYEDHIKPTVEECGLSCLRADEIRAPNQISADLWEKISRARLIVADLTGKNANVFYEVGLAHALGKDVVLLAQSKEDVPFDLSGIRYIAYEFTPRGARELESNLRATLSALTRAS